MGRVISCTCSWLTRQKGVKERTCWKFPLYFPLGIILMRCKSIWVAQEVHYSKQCIRLVLHSTLSSSPSVYSSTLIRGLRNWIVVQEVPKTRMREVVSPRIPQWATTSTECNKISLVGLTEAALPNLAALPHYHHLHGLWLGPITGVSLPSGDQHIVAFVLGWSCLWWKFQLQSFLSDSQTNNPLFMNKQKQAVMRLPELLKSCQQRILVF